MIVDQKRRASFSCKMHFPSLPRFALIILKFVTACIVAVLYMAGMMIEKAFDFIVFKPTPTSIPDFLLARSGKLTALWPNFDAQSFASETKADALAIAEKAMVAADAAANTIPEAAEATNKAWYAQLFSARAPPLNGFAQSSLSDARPIQTAVNVAEPLTTRAAINILNKATGRSSAFEVAWAAKCLVVEAGGHASESLLTARRLERVVKLGGVAAVVHALDVMIHSGSYEAVEHCLRAIECLLRDGTTPLGVATVNAMMDASVPSLVYDAICAYPACMTTGVRIYQTFFLRERTLSDDTEYAHQGGAALWACGLSSMCLGMFKLAMDDEDVLTSLCKLLFQAAQHPGQNTCDYFVSFIEDADVTPLLNVLCRYPKNTTLWSYAAPLFVTCNDAAFVCAISANTTSELAAESICRILVGALSAELQPILKLLDAEMCESSRFDHSPFDFPAVPGCENHVIIDRLLRVLNKRALSLPFLAQAVQNFPANDELVRACAYLFKCELPAWQQPDDEQLYELECFRKLQKAAALPSTQSLLDLLGNPRLAKHSNAVSMVLDVLTRCPPGDAQQVEHERAAVLTAQNDFTNNAKITELGNVVLGLT